MTYRLTASRWHPHRKPTLSLMSLQKIRNNLWAVSDALKVSCFTAGRDMSETQSDFSLFSVQNIDTCLDDL